MKLPATLLWTVSLLVSTAAQAATSLYAVGADAAGVGRLFRSVAPPGPGSALGDGNAAFDGGIAYLEGTGRMYAIGNDRLGQSFLTSFTLASPTALGPTVGLGSGFRGGLAAGPGAGLYAIGADATGFSSLYSVSSAGAVRLGALGYGFLGGLTFDSADGSFYAIAADLTSGVERVVTRIALGGAAPAVTALFSLGDGSTGFLGGLAYDATTDRFATLGSDSSGLSTLYGFSLAGAASLTRLGTVGYGYVDAGLAYAPAVGGPPVTSIPEPATGWLTLVALPLVWRLGRRRSRPAPTSTQEFA